MSDYKVGSLFYELAFKADQTKFSDFIGMVGKLNMSSLLGTGALGQLYNAAKDVLDKVAPIAIEMQTFENVTGLSSQKMKAWDNAAQQLGTTSGATTSAVKSLQSSLASLWSTSPDTQFRTAIGFLNNVGANIKDEDFNPDRIWELFDKIGNSITKLEPAQARMVLGYLHMDESLMNAFRNMKLFNEERERAAVADQGSIKELSEYWHQITKAGQNYLALLVEIGAGLAKIVAPFAEVAGWLAKITHESRVLQDVIPEAVKGISAGPGGMIMGAARGLLGSLYGRGVDVLGMLGIGGQGAGQEDIVPGSGGLANSLRLSGAGGRDASVDIHTTNYITGGDPDIVRQIIEESNRSHREEIKNSMGKIGW